MKHTVAIVDDHVLLAQAIGGLIDGFENFRTIYCCHNGQELLDRLEHSAEKPEIILMDINMPILNGIETTKILAKKYPRLKVLALSIEVNEDTILQMLRVGAKGYLMKDTKKEILQEALVQVVKNGYYHTSSVTKLLVDQLNHETRETQLKEREIEFIQLACTEKTYREIADIMYLSTKTIEGYRDAIYEKLNINNRIGLVLYAIRNQLFKP